MYLFVVDRVVMELHCKYWNDWLTRDMEMVVFDNKKSIIHYMWYFDRSLWNEINRIEKKSLIILVVEDIIIEIVNCI